MANEIQISVNLTVSKNGATITGGGNVLATMAGDQMISNVQIIGTSSEALLLGDVTTTGYVLLKNLDATNFVSISELATAVATTAFCKLLPGDIALFKPNATNPTQLSAIADTGAVNLQVIAIEL